MDGLKLSLIIILELVSIFGLEVQKLTEQNFLLAYTFIQWICWLSITHLQFPIAFSCLSVMWPENYENLNIKMLSVVLM